MYFMWAVLFFLIAIVAGAFGFTDIAADASGIGKILFYVSLTVLLLILLSGLFIFNKVNAAFPNFSSGNKPKSS